MASREPRRPARFDADALAAALAADPNMVVVTDRRGKVAFVNPAVQQSLGWAPEELLDRPIERLVPDAVARPHAERRRRYAAHPVAHPMGIGRDLSVRRRDGTELPVEISLVPFTAPTGEPLVLATLSDITRRKALEAQLLEARKLESLGRLAGGVAHDFNNLLFAIRGTAELALEDLDGAPGQAPDAAALRDDLAQILVAADHASQITSQLLAFGRGRLVQAEPVDVAGVVDKLRPILETLVGDRVRLEILIDPTVGRASIGPGEFDQIVVNLVVNARDAMPRGGTIRVEARDVVFDTVYAEEHFQVEPGEYVMIAVSDDGEGMDQETRLHVFEPFFTTKEPGRGTGLGLATIYGVVRAAGGHIWLYTEPGRGTTFKVYLPRSVADALPDRAAARRSRVAAAHRVVLVAEDDPVVRTLTVRILERAGYTALATGDAREALAIVEDPERRLDVVVTDVSMPGMSGPELARAARVVRPSCGIVLMSGFFAESDPIDDLLAAGARSASKPVSATDLLALVAEVLGG